MDGCTSKENDGSSGGGKRREKKRTEVMEREYVDGRMSKLNNCLPVHRRIGFMMADRISQKSECC